MSRHFMLFEICNHGQRLAIACTITSLTQPMNSLRWIAVLQACRILSLTGKSCRQWKQVAFCPLSSCYFLLYHMPQVPEIFTELIITPAKWCVLIRPGVLKLVYQRTRGNKPLYITENGFSDALDNRRPQAILEHLAMIHRAISEGIPVRGYLHWSLVDNFEWAEGWGVRFGLIELY